VEHITNFGDSRCSHTCHYKGGSGTNIRRNHSGASEMFYSPDHCMMAINFYVGPQGT
jgi:hypothetical protein